MVPYSFPDFQVVPKEKLMIDTKRLNTIFIFITSSSYEGNL
jgi:hypothetical protein